MFVFAYMARGFDEPRLPSLGYAAATTLLCWVVFHWALRVAWPQSLLGDLLPELRANTGLILICRHGAARCSAAMTLRAWQKSP